MDPYKHEFYGDAITFERIIYLQSTTYSIRGSSGNEFKGIQREERARILQHFNIELNNPLTILQQEEAKKFFNNQDESSLHSFFMAGCMLTKVKEETKHNLGQINFMRDRMVDDEKREAELKLKVEQLGEAQKLLCATNEDFSDCDKETAWCQL